MKCSKKNIIFGAVTIALLIASSYNAIAVMQSNELEEEFVNMSLEDIELIFDEFMNTKTIGEIKQEALAPIEDGLTGYDELMEATEDFFNYLPEIGITDDMSLKVADAIIEENWETIEEVVLRGPLKLNRRCSVRINALPTSESHARPRMLFCRPAVRCIWTVDPVVGCNVHIDGIKGLQEINNTFQRGIFLGYAGWCESTFRGDVKVLGLGWLSLSDVKFKDSVEYGSQQGNMQSTPQSTPQSNPNSQTTEEQSMPSGTEGSSPTSN